MREVLVILNYQREIPPFLITQIGLARGYFKRVYLVTRELENDNSATCDFPNVTVVQCKRQHKRPDHLLGALGLFANGGIGDLRRAAADGVALVPLVKDKAKHELCANVLYRNARAIIAREGEVRTVVLATWFSVEAVAAAKLKKRYPRAFAASFAHSFEVQREKNPYVRYGRILFKHNMMDRIFFISQKVLDTYRAEYLGPMGISDANAEVRYLGCLRTCEPPCRERLAGPLKLVSCSGAVEVKRIDIIIDALKLIDDCDIEWTHLGGGPLLEALRQHAADGMPHNVCVKFVGQLTNKQVHEYYGSHQCDLFVNVSAMEGLPVSLMECMAYGIPACATDVGGSSEIVKDGVTGYMLPADVTPGRLAEVIRAFVALPEAAKEELSEACVRIWASSFDAAKNAEGLYMSLAQAGGV